MKMLVVGAGAVGGFYGAMLARAGHDVTFVARGEHGRVIRERGIEIETPSERFVSKPAVVGDVRDASGFGADVVIVAVKASALSDVASGIGAALAEGGVAIPLLNGLDSEEELAAVIGKHRVVGGIAQIASRMDRPGHVLVDGPARVVLAPFVDGQMPLVERLAATFAEAGFSCDAQPDLKKVLWSKLLWNAPFNAVCAITDKNAGEVLAVPELAALVAAGMREFALVARAEGVVIEDAVIELTLEATRRMYSGSVPSMLQDARAARPTEAQALQGAVVRSGEKHGIPTPIHRTLLALVLGLSRGAPPTS